MSEAYEYGEDEFDDEEFDEEDEIRMAILEAEANEVWLEEPGDEDEEAQPPMNPLLGMFPPGVPGVMRPHPKENDN